MAPPTTDPQASARAAFVAAETRTLRLPRPLPLDLGGQLPVEVAYREWGGLDAAGENCVVVCHALTGSADADRWWTGMFGPGRALDPEQDYVVCSNILGSCYGTTGPTSLDPVTGESFRGSFPAVTVRDMVRAQRELLRALGVKKVRLVVGGSLGGMQTLEWGLTFPDLVEAIAPIACSGRHSAWAIGISEAQRQAIYADPRWKGGRYDPADPPAAGLAVARMMAMVSYRSMPSFELRFGRRPQAADLFAMESYLRYQGRQLVERFDAASYVALTRAMDTHDVARGRGEYPEVLRAVRQPALVVSIGSDALYLPQEQEELAALLPRARLARLDSIDGHDAFLIDVDWLNDRVCEFRGRRSSGTARPRAPARPPASLARPGRGEVSLLVLGTGRVGGELLEQLRRQRSALERDYDVSLRTVGIADSHRVLFDEAGVDLEHWRAALDALPATGPFGLPAAEGLVDRLGALPTPVLVDVTTAPAMAPVYAAAFRRGVHVVTSNKLPLALPLREREALLAVRRETHRDFRYETTVGASLPVIDTLRSLVRTGDRVRRIEGSISATLGFVTADLMRGSALSLVVRWAKELGYSEADPRDDLSGLDTARKAVILARELGLPAEVEDVIREPLVPAAALAPGTLADLYRALRAEDQAFSRRAERLGSEGRALRYLVTLDLDAGTIRCGPVEVEPDHRAARLQGVEAYLAFWTDRHSGLPLVVQGAGFGGQLTAGGVLADIFALGMGRGAR